MPPLPCLCAGLPSAVALSVHMCVCNAPVLDQQVDELGRRSHLPGCNAALMLILCPVSRQGVVRRVIGVHHAVAEV